MISGPLLCEILSYGADDHRTDNRDEGRDVMIEVWPAGISRLEETVFTRLVQSSQEGYTDHRKQILCQAGSLNLYLHRAV